MKILLTISLTLIGFMGLAQIDNGLIARYYFDAGTAADDSGNDYHASVVSADLTMDRCGNPNQAYSFDGTQFISIPYSAPFNLNELSISVWFKVADAPNTNQRIISLPVGGGTGFQHFSLNYNSTLGPNKVITYMDPGPSYSGTTTDVNDTKWHHYVGTISTSSQLMISYLDGIQVDLTNFSSPPMSASENLQIGRFNSVFNQNFFGDIDDIRIYDRTITPQEVDTLFQQNCFSLGLADENEQFSFVFSPNPASNYISIQSDSNEPVTFRLYNPLGEVIETQVIKNGENIFDLSEHANSMYIYKLTSNDKVIKSGKLILQ